MWNLVRVVIFFGCLSYSLCEECTINNDCHATLCADHHTPICQHPDGQGIEENAGLCTCSAPETPLCTSGCDVKEDCLNPAHPELECEDARRHCYDGACICSRWPSMPGR